MHQDNNAAVKRRGFLGLVAATAVAGCAGTSSDGADGATSPSGTATASGGNMPTSDGSTAGRTSPAGSCGGVFGDTDQPHQGTSPQWVVNFAYPMGGDVYDTGDDQKHMSAPVSYTSIGYDPDKSYQHVLTVTQFGPLENPFDADEWVGAAGWEADRPITLDGTEQAVAIKVESDIVSFLFGFEHPDGNYTIRVDLAAGDADPCPGTYTRVGRRVLESVEPRA